MNQPIKKSISIQTLFSRELTNIFGNIKSILLKEYPTKEITSEYFLFATLVDKETLLYKTISKFLTYPSINEIYKKITPVIQDNLVTILKPGRDVPFSEDFRTALSFSGEFVTSIEEYNSLITSDVLLLAMINNNKFIEKIFQEEGLTYDIAKELSLNMHTCLNEVMNEKENSPKIQFLNASDIMNGDVSNVLNSLIGGGIPKQKKGSVIDTFCTNLNKEVLENRIHKLVGRKDEINLMTNILSRMDNNNVAIVGNSGVGKTQLVNGLAYEIVNKICPPILLDSVIYRLNVNDVMAGTSLRGMFEERVNNIVKELSSIKNKTILFIDDFHNYITEKKKEEYDITTLLGEMLKNNKVKIIITLDNSGYKLLCDSLKDTARKFQKLTLLPPSYNECKEILYGIKNIYEDFHKVRYTGDAITTCIKTSERYMPERSLPSSAIDILDESGATKKISKYDDYNIDIIGESLYILNQNKKKLLLDKNADADKLDDINCSITKKEKELKNTLINVELDDKIQNITEDDILMTISKHTGIDVNRLSKTEIENLSMMDTRLKEEIIGQDEAIDVVTRAIKRNKIGICKKEKPILSCMCIGSTGVGKTLLAKKLAKEVFGDEKNMLRFDMSEYSDKTSVNKLIGTSAGYIGFDKGGLLTEAVRNKKHTVLLIDEIEKADPEIYNLFLQIFDEGFITDNVGNKIDFKNTIIILTTNVGAKQASLEKGIGFNIDENENKRDVITKELKKKFPPEFINRLDEIVYFNSLTDDNLKKIISIEYNKTRKQFSENGFIIPEIDEKLNDYLYGIIKKEKENGARPVIRTIQKEIEDKVIDYIINNNPTDNNFVFEINSNNIIVNNIY